MELNRVTGFCKGLVRVKFQHVKHLFFFKEKCTEPILIFNSDGFHHIPFSLQELSMQDFH